MNNPYMTRPARPDPSPNAWMDDAACAQVATDVFFPEGKGAHQAAPFKICAGCPVRELCLEYALKFGHQEGIWGGKSAAARSRLRGPRVTGLTVADGDAIRAARAEGVRVAELAKRYGVSTSYISAVSMRKALVEA